MTRERSTKGTPERTSAAALLRAALMTGGALGAFGLAATGVALTTPAERAPIDATETAANPGEHEDQFAFDPNFFDGGAPVMACYDKDNPPSKEVWEMVELAMRATAGDNPDVRFNANDRWSFVGQGQPLDLTWSFVPDNLFIPNGIGEGNGVSTLFSEMDSEFANDGGRAVWIAQFQDCFDRWGELTGVTYTRVTFAGNDWDDGAVWGSTGSPTRGDVRICAKPIDGGSGVLAYNSFPDNGDMVLDRSENWDAGPPFFLFMRNIIMHEHGHGLGFAHTCPQNGGELMEPGINLNFDGPQHDDIRAGQRNYGDPFEPDNNFGQANDLGSFDSDDTLLIGPVTNPTVFAGSVLSIDANGEQDYFVFDLTEPANLTVVVDPLGFTYDDSNQNPNGSCQSGNLIDSENLADLVFELYDGSENELIDVNNTGAGGIEILADYTLGAGTYYIRVGETGASFTQSYTFRITTEEPDCLSNNECDDGDPCNGIELCVDGDCVPGIFPDCNNNGIDDACDISSGFADDCNMNGVPDSCDVTAPPVSDDSGILAPFGVGFNQTHTIVSPPTAGTDVTLTFSAKADLSAPTESVEILFNGASQGFFFVSGANDCPVTPDQVQIILTASEFNTLVSSGGNQLVIDINASGSVDPNQCGVGNDISYVRVETSYAQPQTSDDNNMNGIPDECEEECPGDLTTTGGGNPGEPDGIVDLSDLLYYVNIWEADLGNSPGSEADMTTTGGGNPGQPDGIVDLADLLYYINEWDAGRVQCP